MVYNQIVVILILQSVLYLLITIVALEQREFKKRTVKAIVFYCMISSVWGFSEVFRRLGFLDIVLAPYPNILAHFPLYGLLLLALLQLYLNQTLLRFPPLNWMWWLFGVVSVGVTVIIDSGIILLPEPIWSNGTLTINQLDFSFGLLLLVWFIFNAVIFKQVMTIYLKTKQPLHKNRLNYWQFALIATLMGDILVFGGLGVAVGNNIRLLGMIGAAYAALKHHLPDIRQAIKRSISYLLITLLTVIIYMGGYSAIQVLLQNLPGVGPILTGAVVALLLAVLFQPFTTLVKRLVNRLIFGAEYDVNVTLGEYGLSISNILDLQRLATVSVGLINEALEIKHGSLFLIHHGQDETGDVFYLESIRGMGAYRVAPGILASGSPVADRLGHNREPLMQYDIDLMAEFKSMSETERLWFSNLDMDVYIPIHAKDKWIGMLGLGPKVSGDRYFDNDLALLSTLADQTAVALENAQLVEDLKKVNEDLKTVNEDLKKAYSALDKANQQLQELDKLKTSFIGVITHELRTPYANLIFSLEILEKHGPKYMPKELQEVVEQVSNGVQLAKRMVDNLVTFATFLSKQGELVLKPLNFGQVVKESLVPFESLTQTKDIILHSEVTPNLPSINGDKDRLADAIYHLVHNAVKFNQPQGKIWVDCRRVGEDIVFKVKDTGVGIPADKLPTLWEGFSQMSDPLLRGVEGLGLGLTLVKYVVTAHEGEVWATSTEGEGSTFGFKIPLSNNMASASDSALEGDSMLAVAEDEIDLFGDITELEVNPLKDTVIH